MVKLQSLVDTGFRLASGQLESLRPLGLTLLQAVLHHFGSVEDPLLEGHLILEQYRAQFVSALRYSVGAVSVLSLIVCVGPMVAYHSIGERFTLLLPKNQCDKHVRAA